MQRYTRIMLDVGRPDDCLWCSQALAQSIGRETLTLTFGDVASAAELTYPASEAGPFRLCPDPWIGRRGYGPCGRLPVRLWTPGPGDAFRQFPR